MQKDASFRIESIEKILSALHAACPVFKGEKWIIQQWLRTTRGEWSENLSSVARVAYETERRKAAVASKKKGQEL